MEKSYKIESVLHSGTKGKRGEKREDGRYPLRVGRIVLLDQEEVEIGKPLVLDYVTDENGNDYSGHYLFCSRVKEKHVLPDGILQIETGNSIYVLKAI